MSRYGKRRSNRGLFLGRFYLNPGAQYTTTVVSAIVFAGFVFSGFLLFRYTDTDDLIVRGKRLMAEGKIAWAAKTFQTLVARHKDNYEGHLLLGQAYLELGDRRKAEEEFRTATALRSPNTSDPAADIAMSKFSIARKDFEPAEKTLLVIARKRPDDLELKDALFDLYENWGDTLLDEQKDYPVAVAKYERALRYVHEYQLEDQLKEKLIETITTYADKLDAEKRYDESIFMLKKSLRYRYLPDTLIEIAESYEKAKHIDDAIVWYRKAYEASPNIISIKFSNMLIQKGRELLDQKHPDEAEQYFNEARKVSESANIPMDVLFPIKAKGVKITSELDEETGEFMPKVQVTFENGADRPLNFLVAKAAFYSDDEPIAEVTQVVASPDKPLTGKGQTGASKEMILQPAEALNINTLSGRKLRVKVSVAYTQSATASWKEMAIQETVVKDSQAAEEEPAKPPV